MNRRIIGAGLLLLIFAAGEIFLFRGSPSLPRPGASLAITPRAVELTTPAAESSPGLSSKPAPDAPTEAQRLAAEADPSLLSVKGMLRDYRAQFGENPAGTNEEITRALLGKNAGGANFGSPEATVEKGHLVDRWHHPYFFHQLSGTEMEIRSAGPDGILWTEDDEVLR